MTSHNPKVTKDMAKLIAMFVRDGMEDFHRQHLTYEQMTMINPLMRNAIYTALYAMEHADEDWHCDNIVESKRRAIPEYWEDPEVWPGVLHPQDIGKEATRHFKRAHAEKYGLSIKNE